MRQLPALLLPALCQAAAAVLFGAALAAPFLMTDDYALLLAFDPHVPLYAGRPLAALQQVLTAWAAGGQLAAAPWLRAANILLAGFAAYGAARVLEHSGLDEGWSWLMGLALLTLPGMGLYVAWLSAGHYLPALILAVAAAYLALPGKRPPSPGRLLSAGLCLLAALAFNQAGAMLYFSLLTAALAGQALRGDSEPRRWAAPMILGLGVVAVYFGLYRLALALAPDPFPRAGLGADLPGKLAWAWREVLPNALNLAAIRPETWRTGLVAGVIAAGLAAAGLRSLPAQRRGLLLALAGLPLTMLPGLATAESWASYRTTLPLAAALFWLLLLAMQSLAGRMRLTRTRGTALTLSACLLVWGGITQSENVRRGIIEPQAAQLAALRTALRASPEPAAVALVLCPPDAQNPLPLARYDEFGTRNTVHAWSAGPFVRFALRLEGREGVPVGMLSGPAATLPPGTLLLDGCGLVEEAAKRLER
jgi:hypothetical protein